MVIATADFFVSSKCTNVGVLQCVIDFKYVLVLLSLTISGCQSLQAQVLVCLYLG